MNLSQAFREEGRCGTASRGGARRPPRAGHRAGRLRVHAADRRRPAAGELPARARGPARVRRQPRADRHRQPAGVPLQRTTRSSSPSGTGLPSACARCRACRPRADHNVLPLGGDYNDSVILAEGYVMAPGESLISPFNVVDLARLLRSDVDPAASAAASSPPQTTSGRPRSSSSTNAWRSGFWKDADPIGRRMWKPDSPEEFTHGAGPKSQLLHGRRRRRQHPDRPGSPRKSRSAMYYFPFAQNAARGMTLVTRTAGDPPRSSSAIRQQVTSDRSGAAVLLLSDRCSSESRSRWSAGGRR